MTSDPSCSLLHVQTGRTALYLASWKDHDQIVELLLRREANMNHQNKVKPLMLVCVVLHEEWICGACTTRSQMMCLASRLGYKLRFQFSQSIKGSCKIIIIKLSQYVLMWM